ncbi:MAG: hsp70 family protein [Desulfobacterales bacterium]|nr:hsp70 family protein [Desulfobacterales bacterium]
MDDKKYIIGIDLGTTNSAISYVDLEGKKQIQKFNIDQLTGEGEVSKLPILPSFLYIPGEYEITKESLKLPWKTESDNFTGSFAMEQGSRVPARLISSAKSWLCNDSVDRKSRILPWGSGDDVFKESPVYATSQYLKHIKNAWNHHKGDNEDLYLENQNVIITVPASFDEVARELTVEAATLAGIKNVTLIEEPLAAFYSWLIKNEKSWNNYVKTGELILVCDVGGGTTDFTLITLRDVDGSPKFERIAVGDHLILGGDNVDIKIADTIRQKLQNKNLSKDKWKTLCHQSRQAKENILNEKSVSEIVTIMGSGSSLIAGTISAKIEKNELEKTVFDSFFPVVNKKSNIVSDENNGYDSGLPYEKDPAITRKLCEFLENNRIEVKNFLDKLPIPDHILFNGGSLKSIKIQKQIIESIKFWFKDEETKEINTLENSNHDLAVALGASYYGLVKSGIGVKVGSGSPRNYYLGISTSDSDNSVICLIERGLDEGSKIEIDQNFEVVANMPVSFDVFSSSFRSGDKPSDVIKIDNTIAPLPPVQTVIKYGKKGETKNIPVILEAEYTEIGTLAIYCKSTQSQHRWKLQFQLRKNGNTDISEHEVLDESTVKLISSEIDDAFKNSDKLNAITKNISKIAESSKEKWPLGLIRKVTDELLEKHENRKKSPNHEARWLNLTGFCLRPGYGDSFDEFRIKKLWKLYKSGLSFNKSPQNRSEWWILWRRVAGGLSAGQQRQIFQDISSFIFPKKGVKIKISPQEATEIWMLIANLEKLITKDKIKCGKQMLSQIKPKKVKPQQIWALSRIGARDLLYGSLDRVVPVSEVTEWIETLLTFEYKHYKSVGISLLNLARKTNDRNRDIDPKLTGKIVIWMKNKGLEDRYIKGLTEFIFKEENNEQIFGESLPSGLILRE